MYSKRNILKLEKEPNMNTREYVAVVQHAKGGTESVTITAWNESQARDKLLKMGYAAVLMVY